jgi:hypothetical protein
MIQVLGFDWVMSKGFRVSFQVLGEVASLVQGQVSCVTLPSYSPLSSFKKGES